MASINLLPWREARRKELQQEFFITMAVFVMLMLAILGVVHFFNILRIEHHQTRIQFLNTHISNLENKIKEIELMEKEKQRLKSRIGAIEKLQGNRPLIVRLFDELVNSLPDGVSIVTVKQSGSTITISGIAESNARVSSFMRGLEASEWLSGASLDVIEAKNNDGQRISNFSIRFKQTIADEDEA